VLAIGCLPAQEAELAGAVLVHDDAQGQRDGGQQEGAHGERHVQHLVLLLADQPAVHPQGPLVGGPQGLDLHHVAPLLLHLSVEVSELVVVVVVVVVVGRLRGQRQVEGRRAVT